MLLKYFAQIHNKKIQLKKFKIFKEPINCNNFLRNPKNIFNTITHNKVVSVRIPRTPKLHWKITFLHTFINFVFIMQQSVTKATKLLTNNCKYERNFFQDMNITVIMINCCISCHLMWCSTNVTNETDRLF